MSKNIWIVVGVVAVVFVWAKSKGRTIGSLVALPQTSVPGTTVAIRGTNPSAIQPYVNDPTLSPSINPQNTPLPGSVIVTRGSGGDNALVAVAPCCDDMSASDNGLNAYALS